MSKRLRVLFLVPVFVVVFASLASGVSAQYARPTQYAMPNQQTGSSQGAPVRQQNPNQVMPSQAPRTADQLKQDQLNTKQRLELQLSSTKNSQQKQQWEGQLRDIQQRLQQNAQTATKCGSGTEQTFQQQTKAVDKNFVKQSMSYREASRKASNIVKLARTYLGDEAANGEAMLKLFEEKIALFESQADTFQQQQQSTEQFGCAAERPKFNTEVARLKQTATANTKSISEITTYYEKTLRPEIARLSQLLQGQGKLTAPPTSQPQSQNSQMQKRGGNTGSGSSMGGVNGTGTRPAVQPPRQGQMQYAQ